MRLSNTGIEFDSRIKISQRQLEMTLFHQGRSSSLLCPGILWLKFKAMIEVSNRFREILLRDENVATVEVSCDAFGVDQNRLVQIAQRIFEITEIVLRKVAAECEFLRIMQRKKQRVVTSRRKNYWAQVVNVSVFDEEWYIACR